MFYFTVRLLLACDNIFCHTRILIIVVSLNQLELIELIVEIDNSVTKSKVLSIK